MADDVWKSYEENALTHSAAHYLCAVYELLDEQGYARVTDVARRLNITRGSCSISLKGLKKRGLILEDDNKFLKLSREGRRLAEIVELNAELLKTFFHDVLGVNEDQAEIDACKIEHLISIDTSMRLYNLVRFMEQDSAAVKNFLDTFGNFMKTTCKGNVNSCEICKSICVMEQLDHDEDCPGKGICNELKTQ
tara:strand:+ start:191 stop:769 length:579 start_codon:yes stop_codon:yes gene_type:complete